MVIFALNAYFFLNTFISTMHYTPHLFPSINYCIPLPSSVPIKCPYCRVPSQAATGLPCVTSLCLLALLLNNKQLVLLLVTASSWVTQGQIEFSQKYKRLNNAMASTRTQSSWSSAQGVQWNTQMIIQCPLLGTTRVN